MKCRVVASSVHPDKLSLRAMNGTSVRDALKEAGFKDGDVIEIVDRDRSASEGMIKDAAMKVHRAAASMTPPGDDYIAVQEHIAALCFYFGLVEACFGRTANWKEALGEDA
jgi:predicted RNA polymerase sigma factor